MSSVPGLWYSSCLSPSKVAYFRPPLLIQRDFCPEDEIPCEEAPPLESRRLKK